MPNKNRITGPTTVANKASNLRLLRVSEIMEPKPIDKMNAIKGIASAVVASAAAMLTVFPEHTIAWKVCLGIVGIGSALGIVSQGRK